MKHIAFEVKQNTVEIIDNKQSNAMEILQIVIFTCCGYFMVEEMFLVTEI